MSYVIKFQAPFERLKFFTDNPDISLRRAIILQAIIDASNTAEKVDEVKRYETEAKAWLFGNSKHFRNICYEAGFDPSFITKIAKETIKFHNQKKNTNSGNNKNTTSQTENNSSIKTKKKLRVRC